ncbi:MAG: BlaI/MecI/CopY family transcriptional regulator [Xanthomonadales bacterium]|nr:BlaI/MecI/CopY family transcriptional regulator [Xanthomonadales bacterium]
MQISTAESTIMQALWQRSPQTAEELIRSVAPAQGWHESTVKTLITRLLHKQAIVAEKDGRRSLYSPRLTRDAWVAVQSESLLDRAFGGRIAPLVAHFAEHRKLTRKDLADLKKLIAEIDDAT